jgi:phage/plasmid-associated DNA primase
VGLFVRCRRFHLIPFAVTIPPEQRDKDLAEKLQAEWPAILRWTADGCLKWQRIGLCPPKAVIDATNEYLQTEDSIGTWIEERCECKTSFEDTSAKLFASWKSWAELNGCNCKVGAMTLYLGIDIGLSGALALLERDDFRWEHILRF